MRVRHHGDQFGRAFREGTATVVGSRRQGRFVEYVVIRDTPLVEGVHRSEWSSVMTHPVGVRLGWVVCDMDDGVLRWERTRRDAVGWAKAMFGSDVLERHEYGPGAYSYVLGHRGEDIAGSPWIGRAERVGAHGWDVTQQPLYPVFGEPFDRVERVST